MKFYFVIGALIGNASATAIAEGASCAKADNAGNRPLCVG